VPPADRTEGILLVRNGGYLRERAKTWVALRDGLPVGLCPRLAEFTDADRPHGMAKSCCRISAARPCPRQNSKFSTSAARHKNTAQPTVRSTVLGLCRMRSPGSISTSRSEYSDGKVLGCLLSNGRRKFTSAEPMAPGHGKCPHAPRVQLTVATARRRRLVRARSRRTGPSRCPAARRSSS
jgi:hypothetical protein